MKLTLDYNPPKENSGINHRHKLVLLGSCFSENIGDLLSKHRFECSINPGGILFDAMSVCGFLEDVISPDLARPTYLVERGGRFFSYLHHSSVSGATADEMADQRRSVLLSAHKTMLEADFLIVTLGTAFTQFLGESNMPVANCHKQPGTLFTKKLATPEQITGRFGEILGAIWKLNKKLHVIFTVSPVKYLKDGPVNNNLSKASLLLAVNTLVGQYKSCSYFPAYELVTDDLRDYRFFKEDFSHPNDLAIKYVWEKFGAAWFSTETLNLVAEIEKLNKALAHRMLHHHPEERERLQEHIRKQKEIIRQLEPAIAL